VYHELFLRGKGFLAPKIKRIRVKGQGARKPNAPEREPDFHSLPPLPSHQEDMLAWHPPQGEPQGGPPGGSHPPQRSATASSQRSGAKPSSSVLFGSGPVLLPNLPQTEPTVSAMDARASDDATTLPRAGNNMSALAPVSSSSFGAGVQERWQQQQQQPSHPAQVRSDQYNDTAGWLFPLLQQHQHRLQQQHYDIGNSFVAQDRQQESNETLISLLALQIAGHRGGLIDRAKALAEIGISVPSSSASTAANPLPFPQSILSSLSSGQVDHRMMNGTPQAHGLQSILDFARSNPALGSCVFQEHHQLSLLHTPFNGASSSTSTTSVTALSSLAPSSTIWSSVNNNNNNDTSQRNDVNP
jgi:hypothetical protein